MSDNNALPAKETQSSTESTAVRFCPICGTQMYQGERYGFLCWICPECDFDEPV
ncbi:TPA: zf-TFIIB domain-containing protein [Enterobacter asburiae]|nr:zf-TFIIB domain-containing protein [Enterobacter asburiae]HDR2644813.1 zf-TFIIB domain-containing protein [Enterobacter asburiae]